MKIATAIVVLVTAAALLPINTIYAANLNVRTDATATGKYQSLGQYFI